MSGSPENVSGTATPASWRTEQEAFWAGEFGDDYIQRNQSAELLASNLNFFTRALSNAVVPASFTEFGANIGMNLRALKLLYPNASLSGVEINARAATELRGFLGADNVFEGSIGLQTRNPGRPCADQGRADPHQPGHAARDL